MFGISGAEFLVIFIIAIAVIPARHWPEAARFLARAVKFVRDLVWKISDGAEQIREQIDLEKPIDEISKKMLDEVHSAFRTPVKQADSNSKKKRAKIKKERAKKK